jgi:flavin-dependent dehydrogenase
VDDKSAGEAEVIVIGGGPAGTAIGRLLAARGRSVRIFAPPPEAGRGLGESLPPSARKSLAALGVLPRIDAAGFCSSRGNRVAWGGNPPRLELFDADARGTGYQVWRPALDRLLFEEAVAVGARIERAVVRRVDVADAEGVAVSYTTGTGSAGCARARFVIDATGRAGVIARRHGRRPHAVRTHAWIGLWEYAQPLDGWALETTLVESCDTGWAWSVPVSPTRRCAAVMVDPDRSLSEADGTLERRYRVEIARVPYLQAELASAKLVRVWGADATPYATATLGGPTHLVVGDAASFIDPLSSFGVKKALASAWNGAAVVETCLSTPQLRSEALEFFAAEERAVCESQIRQSTAHASSALEVHRSPFWEVRATAYVPDQVQRTGPLEEPLRVRAAFEALRSAAEPRVRRSASAQFVWKPAIHGHAIGLERAVTAAAMPVALRYLDSVDLPAIVDLSGESREVGDLFDRYCRTATPVPLPSFLKALSVLVAGQALEPAHC